MVEDMAKRSFPVSSTGDLVQPRCMGKWSPITRRMVSNYCQLACGSRHYGNNLRKNDSTQFLWVSVALTPPKTSM